MLWKSQCIRWRHHLFWNIHLFSFGSLSMRQSPKGYFLTQTLPYPWKSHLWDFFLVPVGNRQLWEAHALCTEVMENTLMKILNGMLRTQFTSRTRISLITTSYPRVPCWAGEETEEKKKQKRTAVCLSLESMELGSLRLAATCIDSMTVRLGITWSCCGIYVLRWRKTRNSLSRPFISTFPVTPFCLGESINAIRQGRMGDEMN